MSEEIKKITEEKITSIAEAVLTGKPKRRIWKLVAVIGAIVVVLSVFGAGGLYAYGRAYEDRVYPGVYLGEYSLSGMTGEEVANFVANLSERLNKEGVSYIFDNSGEEKRVTINTAIVEGDAVLDILSVNTTAAAELALAYGRSSRGWLSGLDAVIARYHPESIFLPIKINTDNFTEALREGLSDYEKQPLDASIKITSIAPLKYSATDEQIGTVFDYEKIINDTSAQLGGLKLSPITISRKTMEPSVKAAQLSGFEFQLQKILDFGDIILTYIDPKTEELKTGKISTDKISAWLKPIARVGGLIGFELDKEKLSAYLDNYKYILDNPAAESKFTMEDGKLKEFRSGSSGQLLNLDKTMEAIATVMSARESGAVGATSTVALIVDNEEPKLKMADVNNLGITSIIGVGTSTFKDSHSNRIKNIAHAVERLNGTIIAPGEEFSAIRYAGPFTLENGYLPEEVIKGTEIKKEVGGGMCQIGTTLFRMAMNSGMPITQRSNHSLVVSYYADPINGNPGTDAAIYEPILDLKFMNDTGNYMLIETKIDYKKQMLAFTLWGKPDGRYGYFTHPLVSKWIPAGEPQTTYTTTLAPGVTKCQNAFRGAIASFTYTRFTSSTEKIERVFTSNYRALPKICVVGVSSSTPSGGSSASSSIPTVVETDTSSST
ncbi:MAG: VanW family protein [Patescibacteria group bacterium]